MKDRSRKHPDAWRLPAEQVERLLSDLVAQHVSRPDAASSMIQNASAAEIVSAAEKLKELTQTRACLALVERADLRPGLVTVQLSAAVLAKQLGCQSEQIYQAELMIKAPFQMRRRGVELRLHLSAPPPEIDQTLVQNIMKGRRWLSMVIAGKTFSEIAETDGVSKRRVQDVTSLALLAPDILGSIAQGEQPEGLTTDYLIKTRFPAIWSEQRVQFAAL